MAAPLLDAGNPDSAQEGIGSSARYAWYLHVLRHPVALPDERVLNCVKEIIDSSAARTRTTMPCNCSLRRFKGMLASDPTLNGKQTHDEAANRSRFVSLRFILLLIWRLDQQQPKLQAFWRFASGHKELHASAPRRAAPNTFLRRFAPARRSRAFGTAADSRRVLPLHPREHPPVPPEPECHSLHSG